MPLAVSISGKRPVEGICEPFPGERHTQSQPRPKTSVKRSTDVRDEATSRSIPQSTGSQQRAAANFDTSPDNSGAFVRIGQAAMLLSGAALLAAAARKGHSWKSAGAVALAGAPLLFRGATGHWP